MSINLGTLEKLSYENLAQFIDDINRNFAVVQNSPLFKGIPGREGLDGDDGPIGLRGSKIFFIDFVKFNLQFPSEITLSNQIDLVFLNSKLNNVESKTKILTAIGSQNLIDKDIFVLTNSLLISYNYAENKFYDTGTSLNNSVTNEIQNIINNLFQSYLPILQAGIRNVFENYATLAKNYSDTNNGGITTGVNQTSVYSPFIQGVTSNVGIPIENHKYYGVGQSVNGESTDNTVVFGSIVKYYKMLMQTLNTDGSQTLTSNYAPGVNNIPAAIFMQDTYNNGLLFGFKGKQNLKSFGSIFKNDSDELEIKSDSGKLLSDFSSLKIHKNRMRYNKLVQFSDSLELSNNLFIGGVVDNFNFKTGVNAYDDNPEIFEDIYNPTDQINKRNVVAINNKNGASLDRLIPGQPQYSASQFLITHADNIYLRSPSYKDKVLVTNADGGIGHFYKVERKQISDYNNTSTFETLQEINENGASNGKFLTTYYYNYLVRKINLLFNTQVSGFYWTKAEFNSNVIPSLKLNSNFSVDGSASLAGVATFNSGASRIILNPNNLITLSDSVRFGAFDNKVLVGDATGTLKKNVTVDYNEFGTVGGSGFTPLTTTAGQFDLITKYHYNKLISYLNSLGTSQGANFWTKPEFDSFTVPTLNVSNALFSRKYLAIGSNLTTAQNNGSFSSDPGVTFSVDAYNGLTQIRGEKLSLLSDEIQIGGFVPNQLLGTVTENYVSPINMIGSLAGINTTTYNTLNNQAFRSIADNKTVASLILGITTTYDNLKAYIDSQINTLNTALTTQINNLATDVYTKIQVINNDLVNIHNELGTKASISYVDGHVANINQNIVSINQTLSNHKTAIANLQAAMATKVDKSVFEPWKAIVDEFMTKQSNFPKGGIILWEGKVVNGTLSASIPTGWEEVTSMRGRTPVGWSNNGYMDYYTFFNKFTTLGEEGGAAKHSLVSDENGPHTHTYKFDASGDDRDSRNEDWANGFNTNEKELRSRTTSSLIINSSGLGTPHNNTQPYRTVIFIRSINGY